MSLSAFPNLILHVSNMPKVTCLTCGKQMCMTHIEKVSAYYDIRAFECDACEITEEFVVELQ